MRVFQLQGSQHSASSSGGLRPIVMRVLIMGLAVFLAVTIVPGIESEGLGAGLAAVLVLTVLNTPSSKVLPWLDSARPSGAPSSSAS